MDAACTLNSKFREIQIDVIWIKHRVAADRKRGSSHPVILLKGCPQNRKSNLHLPLKIDAMVDKAKVPQTVPLGTRLCVLCGAMSDNDSRKQRIPYH